MALSDKVIKGKLECDSSVLTYAVSLKQDQALSKRFFLLCHMQDESSDDKINSFEWSYIVKDAPWLHNENCRDTFLEKFSEQITKNNGTLPNINCVKKLVKEIENNSMNMSITSEDQFLRKNKSDVKGIRILEFKNLKLNEEFFIHFNEIIEREFEFDKIEFIDCALIEGLTFAEILDSCNIINLSIINCSIAEDDLSEVLLRINPCSLKSINLSKNQFTESVIKMLKERIDDRLSLESINLKGTGLDSKLINQINNLCHN